MPVSTVPSTLAFGRYAPPVARYLVLLLLAVSALWVAAFGGLHAPFANAVAVTGASLSLVLAAVFLMRLHLSLKAARRRAVVASIIELETSPCFVTNSEGVVQSINEAAKRFYPQAPRASLDRVLRATLANPNAVLFRLQSRARSEGRADEVLATRHGRVRMTVRCLGDDHYVWRFGARCCCSGWGDDDVLPSLPILTVGRGGTVLSMNKAAREMIGSEVSSLHRLFVDQPVKFDVVSRIQTNGGVVSVVAAELSKADASQDMLLIPLRSETEVRGSTSFAELPVPLMRLSPTGLILEANRLATQLLGGRLSEDTTIEQVMQGLGRPIKDWLRETVDLVAAPRSEFLRLNRNDTEMFVQVTLNRVTRDGEVGLIAVLNDATELKTLEAQFVQSQKMQAVGQLAGGVAHDFNNLLTAISGYCDLLLLRHDQSDPDYGDLVQINQNANRAAALVSQLLAFSRKQTLRPETLDLRDTLSDLIHLLNRLVGEKITLTLSHDPVLKPVRADKRQLEQVLMNLVVNARDAMPEGGEVRIETEVVSLTQPLVRDRAILPAGEYVLVKVIDSGVGIAPDKLQKVFEPFYTTKRTGEGTGLGLSTVYGIVKQTGGYIFVDSVEGSGSEFSIFLPVYSRIDEPEPLEQAPAARQSPKHGEGVVLLVEDEAPVRAFASRALRLRGYTVLEAHSGEEALRLLEDKSLSVDVFVTDVVMPGLDGPSWVRRALVERPQVRVIFMSGNAEGAFGDSGPEIAGSVFLAKPFSLNQLTETVYQQLS
ncbi:response regulator [Ruegeria sediminis]|uniref:histidine kinase n=1 Tax=Ruegeria sediminis TaxID=2583820 RepID=A0ABY2WZU8_9RHOB|nr:PAS domain-containing sensor histidine kinase [Ruegeria sediminis]TMV08513.1 response regulator [Ruegeria sediminis]